MRYEVLATVVSVRAESCMRMEDGSFEPMVEEVEVKCSGFEASIKFPPGDVPSFGAKLRITIEDA